MTPLNHIINYSAELSQRPSFFSRNISSRFIMGVAIPFELSAVLENAIKLPFQTVAAIIKIPAKVLNVVVNSISMKEFESKLPGPLDVIITAIKIAGYAIGLVFTTTLGIISPYRNFRLHCALNLISDFSSIRAKALSEEIKQKEIATHEKIIETRLKKILEAKRQEPIVLLTEEKRNEIESLTKVSCPSIETIIKSVEDKIDQHPTIDIKDEKTTEIMIAPITTIAEQPIEFVEVVEEHKDPTLEIISNNTSHLEEILSENNLTILPFPQESVKEACEKEIEIDNTTITHAPQNQEDIPNELNELVNAN